MTTLENYIESRFRKYPSFALTWDAIVWEAERSIGIDDANEWLENIKDIINDPYFVKDPIPDLPINLLQSRLAHKKWSYLKDKTWVTPHRSAFRKLGYYQIYYPDLSSKEVFGEDEVREALSIS